MKAELRRRDGESPDELYRKILAYEIDFRRLAREASQVRIDYAKLRSQLTELATGWNRYGRDVERTIWWRLRQGVRRFMFRRPDIVQPVFEVGEQAAQSVVAETYADWMSQHSARPSDVARMRTIAPFLQYRPRISVLMPVFEPPESFLRAAIESVLGQAYPDWELCIVDDASPSPYVADVVREYAGAEPRIHFVQNLTNGHIARASNRALQSASGEFIALLDHDDVLVPEALFENALALNAQPDLDFLYSDEDKMDALGHRSQPAFKPDWSPDTFLTKMYTSHLAVFRRSLVDELGGFREGFEGAQDYDLVLRVTERTARIHHIPKVLYSWRQHIGSVAENPSAKAYAYEGSRRALESAMQRRGEGGVVHESPIGIGHWTIRYPIRSHEKVSVIVPTRNGAADVRRCLDSLFALTQYPAYEVILLDNGSDRSDALSLFATYQEAEPLRFRYLRHDVPFNYSAINNVAAADADGRYLLFLNNDTEIIDGNWMSAMVEQAQRPSIGAVGAKLLYADGKVQHAGVVIGIGGAAGHSHRHEHRDSGGYMNTLALTTNYSAVTAACMMLRRDIFNSVGGFDETFAVAYNDVDLCLRIRQAGFHNVYLPYVELYHYESRSRGYDVEAEQIERDQRERMLLQKRWQTAWSNDPFYSPHLSLSREDLSLGF